MKNAVEGFVESILPLTVKESLFTFKHNNPKNVHVEPGQYLLIKPVENTFRAYSVTLNTQDTTKTSIVASIGHNGIGSNYLRELEIGDKITYFLPNGFYKLKQPFAQNLYFFATSTGIAPFIAMFYKLLELNYQGQINLFFGIREEKDLFFNKELDFFKSNFINFTYQVFVSKSIENPKRITSVLPNLDYSLGANYYLCGNPLMIEEVKEYLLSKGVEKQNILYEKFTVSAPK